MRPASTPIAIGAALWLVASSALALGFGRVSNATQLGQPLNFAAAVHLEGDESLARECVAAEVVSGENKLLPDQVRVTLEGAGDTPDRSVRITTTALIDEPVVTVSVTLGCNAKVTRKFVAFIDPPLINLAQAEAPEALPPQQIDSQVAPIVRIVQGDKPVRNTSARPQRTGAVRSRLRAPVAPTLAGDAAAGATEIAAPPKAPKTRRSAAASRQPSLARAVPAGPRLRLESAAAVAGPGAASAVSTAEVASAPGPAATAAETLAALAAAASAPKPADAIEQLARERQRIQALEEGLAKLRSEAQATQKSLATLQARVKEAQTERYTNPLVYALAWLSALLALAVAALWWRQSRVRNSAHWWTSPTPAPAPARAGAAAAAAAAEPAASAPLPLGVMPTAADAFALSTIIIEHDEPAAASALRSARPEGFAQTMPAPAAAEPPRELSVEELIDLEQQAEFFIVLGQDEAAIELLMSHVRSDGGISPLPYLKLLEIYRRRGESESYERIRDRFNRRFNAYAPDWDADLQQGRTLIDYPDIIRQLQALWSSPVRVMETLDASLFKRNQSDETFDLPAYRELLFLYSIARELAEQNGAWTGGGIDLLLPLDGDDAPAGPISRLMPATGPGEFQHSDLMTMSLDLDVSLAPSVGAAAAAETMPGALHHTSDHWDNDSDFVDLSVAVPRKPDPSGKR